MKREYAKLFSFMLGIAFILTGIVFIISAEYKENKQDKINEENKIIDEIFDIYEVFKKKTEEFSNKRDEVNSEVSDYISYYTGMLEKYDSVIMTLENYETKVKINKKELLSCIDRATLLIKENDKKPIIMNILDGSMELKMNSAVGSMNEEIDIAKQGKDLMIGFNPKFLIDALRVIEDEEIDMYLVNPKAPCFIRDEEGKYIYLILPVNFNTGV